MSNSHSKNYTCFICLNESSDPNICTHCGSKIEILDMSKSIFSPPAHGKIVIIKQSNTSSTDSIIKKSLEEISTKYRDSFIVESSGNTIVIKCNDIAASRVIELLGRELSQKDVNFPITFVKD